MAKWYDVCNDYSLEERAEAPDTTGMERIELDAGTAFGDDLDGEGALYFYGFAKLNGFYLEEF